MINARDLKIERPSLTGPGLDPSGANEVIAEGLEAIVVNSTNTSRDDVGRSTFVETQIFIDPIDCEDSDGDCNVDVLVQEGDWVSWTGLNGRRVKPTQVTLVAPIYIDFQDALDSIQMNI